MRKSVWCLLVTGLACGEPASRSPNEETAAAPSVQARPSQPLTASPGDSAPRAQDTAVPGERSTRATKPVVLIIGTSLTAGLGLDPDDAYPAALQRMADSAGYSVDIVAAGVSGETSAGALRRMDWLLQQPADVIVIETGANDGLRGLDVDSTRANLREILRRSAAAKPAAELFLVQMEAPPNLGARYTSSFRSMFREVAAASGAKVIPFLLDGVAGVREMNQSDGIHPNVRGSRRVAQNVWEALDSALRARSRP